LVAGKFWNLVNHFSQTAYREVKRYFWGHIRLCIFSNPSRRIILAISLSDRSRNLLFAPSCFCKSRIIRFKSGSCFFGYMVIVLLPAIQSCAFVYCATHCAIAHSLCSTVCFNTMTVKHNFEAVWSQARLGRSTSC
jgi:hypothetical protein